MASFAVYFYRKCSQLLIQRDIEIFVNLKLTTEVGYRDLWERYLEVILGDSK